MAAALKEAATWVGSDNIVVGRVEPPEQKVILEKALIA